MADNSNRESSSLAEKMGALPSERLPRPQLNARPKPGSGGENSNTESTSLAEKMGLGAPVTYQPKPGGGGGGGEHSNMESTSFAEKMGGGGGSAPPSSGRRVSFAPTIQTAAPGPVYNEHQQQLSALQDRQLPYPPPSGTVSTAREPITEDLTCFLHTLSNHRGYEIHLHNADTQHRYAITFDFSGCRNIAASSSPIVSTNSSHNRGQDIVTVDMPVGDCAGPVAYLRPADGNGSTGMHVDYSVQVRILPVNTGGGLSKVSVVSDNSSRSSGSNDNNNNNFMDDSDDDSLDGFNAGSGSSSGGGGGGVSIASRSSSSSRGGGGGGPPAMMGRPAGAYATETVLLEEKEPGGILLHIHSIEGGYYIQLQRQKASTVKPPPPGGKKRSTYYDNTIPHHVTMDFTGSSNLQLSPAGNAVSLFIDREDEKQKDTIKKVRVLVPPMDPEEEDDEDAVPELVDTAILKSSQGAYQMSYRVKMDEKF